MNKGLTVKNLYNECKELIEKGYGDRHVCITDDDEANGYHTLFFGFEIDEDMITEIFNWNMLHDNNDPNEIVLLG